MNKKQLMFLALTTALTFSAFTSSTEAKSLTYRVKSGDTLWRISRVNHVSVSQLKTWNHLKSDKIRVGQTLSITNPNSSKKTSIKKVSKSTKSSVKVSKSTKSIASSSIYVVKSGDSLYSIAKKHQLTVNELKQNNNLTSNLIVVGQSLKISKKNVKSTTSKPQPKPNNKLAVPTVEKQQYATVHTVRKGEYLSLLATKYGTTVSEIKRLNGLSNDMLYIGQELRVTDGALKMPKAPAFLANGKFPLAQGTYAPFGDTWHDTRTYGGNRNHEGTDIIAPLGTAIYAAADGIIVNFGWNELGGWRISIKSPDGHHLYYAHMSKYAQGMAKGKTVKKGQVIGYVGNTGYGPEGTAGKFATHLHFGIYDSYWKAINPYNHLKYWEAKEKGAK